MVVEASARGHRRRGCASGLQLTSMDLLIWYATEEMIPLRPLKPSKTPNTRHKSSNPIFKKMKERLRYKIHSVGGHHEPLCTVPPSQWQLSGPGSPNLRRRLTRPASACLNSAGNLPTRSLCARDPPGAHAMEAAFDADFLVMDLDCNGRISGQEAVAFFKGRIWDLIFDTPDDTTDGVVVVIGDGLVARHHESTPPKPATIARGSVKDHRRRALANRRIRVGGHRVRVGEGASEEWLRASTHPSTAARLEDSRREHLRHGSVSKRLCLSVDFLCCS